LDRTIAPPFRPVRSIKLPGIERYVLSNGVDVIAAGYSEQEIIKLELVFFAGYIYSDSSGLNSLFSRMLLGGTEKRNGNQVVSGFDQYGGFLEIAQGLEHLTITLHGLRNYLPEYLSVLTEILDESIFPKDELELQRKIGVQSLQMNLEKPAYLARMAFKKLLYGENHPFGKDLSEEDIAAVQRDQLISFYKQNIKGSHFKVFISGKVTKSDIDVLEKYLGNREVVSKKIQEIPIAGYTPSKLLIEKKENMQSTLRIGKPVIGRKHPDFFRMLVANTTFGGYFGSRLMRNIREEKGFTYGISSSVNPLGTDAYWVIGADVVKQNTLETLQEISKELATLKEILVSESELETVKNYMCGAFAGSLSTPFEVMDRYKNLELFNLPANYYDHFTKKIQEVSREDVAAMANLYLDETTFSEVIVGERI
jgi:zinc protease